MGGKHLAVRVARRALAAIDADSRVQQGAAPQNGVLRAGDGLDLIRVRVGVRVGVGVRVVRVVRARARVRVGVRARARVRVRVRVRVRHLARAGANGVGHTGQLLLDRVARELGTRLVVLEQAG